MEAQWGMAPVAPPPPAYEPAADPMYAPAPELSYQAPYVPPVQNYDAGSSMYAPAPELSYQQPYVEPAPAYSDPMQDPWNQMAYAPAEQMAPTYESLNLDPSMGQQFGWDQGYTPPAPEPQPFFGNQFADADARFDATTDPNSYARQNALDPIGAGLGWATSPIAPLADATQYMIDAQIRRQNTVNQFNPVSVTGSATDMTQGYYPAQEPLVSGAANLVFPQAPLDIALMALPGLAALPDGGAYKALGEAFAFGGDNLAGQLDELPASALRAAARRYPEAPGQAVDIANLSRQIVGAADDVGDTPFAAAKKTLEDQFAGMKKGEIRATLEGAGFGDEIVANKNGTINLDKTYDAVARKVAGEGPVARAAAEDAAGQAARTPAQIAETVARGDVPEGTIFSTIQDVTGGTVDDAIRMQGKSPADEAVQYLTDAPTSGTQVGLPGAEVGTTAKQAQILAQAQDNLIAKTARDAEVAGIYEKFRPYTYKLTGDVADPRIASVLNMEDNLRQALRSTGMADEQMNVILKEWREQALPRIFKGKELADAKAFLKELSQSIPKNNAYDVVSQALKESTLALDLAIFGQNVEAATRRGALPIATGVIKDTAQHIATRLHLPGMVKSTVLNELDQVTKWQLRGIQFGAKSSAGIEEGASIYGKIPGVGKKVEAGLNKLTDWQYGDVMGLIKLRAAQGLEAQYRFLDWITLGKFNLNPDDPKNWQRIADYVNTIGSTAARATNPGRAKLEARTLLSATMTRAQINEALIAVRALRSPADMANLLNYLGSTASLLGAGWALNDQFGVGEFTTNALDSNYGKIVSKFKDETGRYRVFDITPQYSFEKMLAREINALRKGDWAGASEAAQRFGFGRANIPIGTGARLLGKGYGTKGNFEAIESGKTLPMSERIQASAPVPLSLQQMVQPGVEKALAGEGAGAAIGAVADPINLIAGALGQTEYPENTYSARDRAAQETMGKPFEELNVIQQAQVYAKMAAEGVPIEDYNRRQPYEDARDAAYQKVATSDFGEAFVAKYPTYDKLRDEVVKRMLAQGWDETDITDEADKFIKNDLGLDFEQETHDIRISIVQNDPDIVPSLIDPSEEVKKIYRDSKAGK